MYRLLLSIDQNRKLGRRYRSELPVVSVGNIVTGGTGKTPLVQYLITKLEREWMPVVLSRGYRRASNQPLIVDVRDASSDPGTFGDEPALILRSMRRGIVAVGADRTTNLRSIESSIAATNVGDAGTVVLLDDGFQHLQIARDVDIVIVDDRTAGAKRLLPFGPLREPHSALGRATILLATSESALDCARRHAGTGVSIYRMWIGPSEIDVWESGQHMTRSGVYVLVAGVARPRGVEEAAMKLGANVAQMLRYRDHHRYAERDVETILEAVRKSGANAILTTEKDAVKLDRFPELRPLLHVIRREVDIDRGEQFVDEVCSAIRQRIEGTR